MTFRVPSDRRVRSGEWGSDDSYGNNGAFILAGPIRSLLVIASDGDGWEHVSVSTDKSGKHTPNWMEMCWVKDVFWDAEDVAMQLHPRRSEYVNHHPGCLHLWRPIGSLIPTPPMYMIAPKGPGEAQT